MIVPGENNYEGLDRWLADKKKVFLVCDGSIQFLKDFNAKLNDLKAEMGLYRCHSFDTKDQAAGFIRDQKEAKLRRTRGKAGE